MKIRQTVIQVLERRLTRLRRDRVRVAAMRSAYAIVAQRHPIWVESGFDQHFLQHNAAPLLEPSFQGGDAPDPQALAAAWCAQFFFTEKRYPRALATILPVMTDFVYVLKSELGYLERPMPGRVLNPQIN